MRQFFSVNIPCSARCKYCYARRSDYIVQPLLGCTQKTVDANKIILYPSCDGDFFNQVDSVKQIEHLSSSYEKIYVSVSSKTKPNEIQLGELLKLHEWLQKNDKGFVKFAISLSNRSMIDEIEPGTIQYKERLNLAKLVKNIGIPLSLTIKPVLPFIPENEYTSILDDFSSYLKCVSIGGLYVDKSSDFYQQYFSNSAMCIKRKVTWLLNEPEWDYIEDKELMMAISSHAKKINMHVFTSDSDVIQYMIDGGTL